MSESHAAHAYVELRENGDYYYSITIPSLICATYGGGTGLATQRECLEMMDCYGSGKALRFAEIVAAPGAQIIDVRTPEEFAEGHLDGAININVQDPEFMSRIAALDPSGLYAVYCRSGNRSQAAVTALADSGIPGVFELETGIIGWQEAGLPVVR